MTRLIAGERSSRSSAGNQAFQPDDGFTHEDDEFKQSQGSDFEAVAVEGGEVENFLARFLKYEDGGKEGTDLMDGRWDGHAGEDDRETLRALDSETKFEPAFL
jgi:hypothetical protein